MNYQLIIKKNGKPKKVKATGKWVYFAMGDLLGIQVEWTEKGALWFKDKTFEKYIDDSELDIIYENN